MATLEKYDVVAVEFVALGDCGDLGALALVLASGKMQRVP
jgi:hypothetical protein